MLPTPVRVGVMDSMRPGRLVDLPVEQLSPRARLWRGLKRMLLVSAVGAVVVPIPLLHVCGFAMVLVAGPVAGVFAWRDAALIGMGEVPCPKCTEPVKTLPGLAGWPARLHCSKCGAMVELNPAQAVLT